MCRWCSLLSSIDRLHHHEGADKLHVLDWSKVVKTVTGEDIDAEHLGGASVHASKSGVTSFTAKTEEEAMDLIKKLLSTFLQTTV